MKVGVLAGLGSTLAGSLALDDGESSEPAFSFGVS